MICIRLCFYRCLMVAAMALLSVAVGASEMELTQFQKVSLPYEASVVEHVYKDKQGMVWFATRRGLFSYDGYNIRRLVEGNYHVLVAIDDNLLCLGSDDGLRWLNLRTEQFVLPYKDVPTTGEVRSLACQNGRLYVGTRAQGMYCLDLNTHSWQHYQLPDGENDIVFSLEPTDDGVYIAHQNGLAFLNGQGRICDMGIDDNVYSVWHDKLGKRLWIGTEHHLISRSLTSEETSIVVSGSTINQVVTSPIGEILLASEFGLKVLNPQTGSIKTIAHDVSSPQNSLPSNTIHHIYCDNENIWIATDRGVAVTRHGDSFEAIPLPSITQQSDGNVFSRILVDSNGGFWLGGDNGLLHISGQNARWFKVGNGVKKSIIRSIYEDCDQQIWIATDASIAKYNSIDDRFDYFTLTDRKGRNANWAYDIYEDAYGRLWVATYMDGLYVVDKKALLSSGGSLLMKTSPFGNSEAMVSTIYRFFPDDKGVLWAYTSQGLTSINTNTLEIKLHQKMFIDNMILVGKDIWLDVQGRLYRYDTQSGVSKETGFYIQDGMIHAFVAENNRLWMSTSEGLFYIDTTDGTIHPYRNYSLGLTVGTYLEAENLIVWGGEDMLCKQQLTETTFAFTPSKVFVSAVKADGSVIAGCVPRFENTIEIDGREDIAIDLATFEYNSGHAEVFWYKIGKNGEWHALPNGSNRITLSHLSGGEYSIYLTTDAEHADKNITEYVLRVPYPWFLRWWAWLLYFLAALATLMAILNFYRRREQLLFEQRERERVMTLTQQKMDFFVDMSHELKTPLSLIIAPLAKLMSETQNAKLRYSMKSIHSNAMKLNDLIHCILNFKLLEAESDDKVLTSHVDICAIISDCVEEFAESAKERNIGITMNIPESPILMAVDVVKLQMIVRNIVSNAMKYVKDDTGRIMVHIEKKSSEVLVSIKDNGPGVPSSELPKIFNRYYIGQNAHKGSGIGLSVVKKYVELHGGEVRAENKDGLKLSFSLPLTALKADTWHMEPTGIEEKTEVLIVDDNHEILEFLTTALNTSYHCVTAESGEEAIKIIEAGTIPDLIITDQMMPGIDGTELCHRIRHNHKAELVPIIMLTAKDDLSTELKSIRSGADVFMPKPFDLRKLQLHIVQLLNKRRAIEQNARIESITSAVDNTHPATSDEELMERITSLINSNMHSEEFNVTKLCNLLCMDQKQLYRKLKQLTGHTPVSFIRKQRMKRAAVLLSQERFTVSEVMYQVGFSSASYFTKCFTKEFGLSPKECLEATSQQAPSDKCLK